MHSAGLYNKYRPIQLSDVIGQDVVVRSLSKQAKTNTLSHAYLLSGRRGLGKTSIARIISSIMTCPERKSGSDKSCGRCPSCVSIHNGSASDVIEIDGASSGGVDDARDIKKGAYYPPHSLPKKIYIIDECHMLTTEAKNALLKVLEQPPPYVVFIFCTTEPHKMLGTIVSRCQRWNLVPISSKAIADRLTKVAEREGIKMDSGVATSLARMSAGSMRDAYVNLEQISAYSSGNVTASDFSEFFGTPDRRKMYQIVSAVADQNPAGLLKIVNDLIMASVDPRSVLAGVSDILRNIFTLKYCRGKDSLLDLDEGEIEELERIGEKISEGALMKMSGAFSRIDKQMAVNINERWILEAALIGCILIVNSEPPTKKKDAAQK